MMASMGEMSLFMVLRRFLLLQALCSAWCACVAQQRTDDGRVILNLGYFTSYGGNFVSSGEGTVCTLIYVHSYNDWSWLGALGIHCPTRPARHRLYVLTQVTLAALVYTYTGTRAVCCGRRLRILLQLAPVDLLQLALVDKRI